MDICLYISDQHAFEVQGYAGNKIVRTPNLDRIAAEGTAFMNACTSYPICVPARMSMLTSQYTSSIEVMSNHGSLNSNIPTFMHCLNTSGYETVLCGRMHFIGGDQRHGFSKRIAGDITQVFNNRPERIAMERGVHDKTPQGGPNSVAYVGGGNSPVLEYDRYVIENALKYLESNHDRPQFLCVGTYAPHHPFVAPGELFEYYYDKVDVPEYSFDLPEHPALEDQFRDTDPELIRAVRAAYYGMVEFEDQQIGKVYDAFQNYLKRNSREGLFIYVSDHGEHEGYRGYYGKNTFYECSVHIPMIFAGTGVKKGGRKEGAVSLMDVGPTILDISGSTALPVINGRSLRNELNSDQDNLERMVISEVGGNISSGKFSYGQMVRYQNFKFIHYEGYDEADVLYDLDADPRETKNVIEQHSDLIERFRKYLSSEIKKTPEELGRLAELEKKYMAIMAKCDFDSEELWHATEAGRHEPDPCFRSRITIQDWISSLKQKRERA